MPATTGLALFDGMNDALVAAFGEPFTLRRATATPMIATGRGVFDARHYAIEGEGGVPLSEYQVTLSCRRDAIDPVETGDVVDARGESWTVRDIRPDSEGWVALALEMADPGS
jgi:hypothetical protein